MKINKIDESGKSKAIRLFKNPELSKVKTFAIMIGFNPDTHKDIEMRLSEGYVFGDKPNSNSHKHSNKPKLIK